MTRAQHLLDSVRSYPPDKPAGSSGATIMFQIETVDYDCSSVEAIVVGAPCTGSPQLGDTVTVYDPRNCVFDRPEAELFDEFGNGLIGIAHKLRVELDGYTPECIWVVADLCCGSPI